MKTVQTTASKTMSTTTTTTANNMLGMFLLLATTITTLQTTTTTATTPDLLPDHLCIIVGRMELAIIQAPTAAILHQAVKLPPPFKTD